MRVADISKYVFNLHSSLFSDDLKYEDLHQTLRCYLWRQSKIRRSPFKRVRYGVYAIKDDMAIQLDIDFENPYQEEENDEDFGPLFSWQKQVRKFPNNPTQLLLFQDFD